MHFLKLVLIAASAVSVAQACKCVEDGEQVDECTANACGRIAGGVLNGDDCDADSISEALTQFRLLCADCIGDSLENHSDCDR